MGEKKQSFLVDVWMFSKALLHDRPSRRRFLAQLLIGILVLLVLGNWPLREWVGETPLRFLAWWGMAAFLTIWMLLLAVYDASRVRREIMEEEDWK